MTVMTAFRRLTLILLVVFSQKAAQAETYTVTDLGTLGGTLSFARAIDNSGEVVGTSQVPGDGTYEAFAWTAGGGMQGLGTMSGTNNSDAFDINDVGQIVGRSYATGNVASRAFLIDGSGMQDLGISPSGYSEARGINNNGQVVGNFGGGGAFTWSSGSGVSLIQPLAGAYGVNDAGEVVGAYLTSPSTQNPFFWDASKGLTDLGTLGGPISTAYAINASNQIVGSSELSPGVQRAFLYQAGQITDLGTLGGHDSVASSINSLGQIVGGAYTSGGQLHAFIDLGGVMTDLNTLVQPGSPWVLRQAFDINDQGQIVGYGYRSGIGSAQHAFLLTPVPEPTTLLLAAMAGLALYFVRTFPR